MQTLLSALKAHFKKWPEGQEHFTCDPDGEVRGSTNISDDFFPKKKIAESERSSDFGSQDGAVVTKEIFESN